MDKVWYAKGLKFECTSCGRCCTGAPGYVWVTTEEIARIAYLLTMPVEDFVLRYIRKVGDRYSLREIRHGNDHACVFLDEEKKCKIYEERPTQCRTFPWWPRLLETRKDWEAASKNCEGIHLGNVVSKEDIEKNVNLQKNAEAKT